MPRHPTRRSSGRGADAPHAVPTAGVSRPGAAAGRTVVLAALLDAASVLAFAAAGRMSHARDGGAQAVLGTAWPFLAGAAVGWLLTRAWRAPDRVWPTGVGVWVAAWLGGLGLRAAVGDGTAPAFAVVAGLVLAALLVGRRVVTMLSPLGRRRPSRSVPGR